MARAGGGLATFLLPLLLAACGDTPLAEAWRMGEAPAIPGTTVPADGPALLLLAPRRAVLLPVQEGSVRRLWRSEDGIVIATEGARIIATAGLGQMVMASRMEGEDPLEDPRALLGTEATARRVVDLAGADRDPASMRFGLVLDCRLRGHADAGWLVVEERCTGGRLGFTNRFWIQPESGAVRRSEQWAGDGLPLLVTEMRGS